VPLFGVLLADWLLAGAHYSARDVFATPAVRLDALLAWLVGFCLYQWLSPIGPSWWTRLVAHTHPGNVSFTASLPAFAASFALASLAALRHRRLGRTPTGAEA
jgi:purine-cytosine permease-like protein